MARSYRSFGIGLTLAAVLAAGCGSKGPATLGVTRPAVNVQHDAWDMKGTFNVVFKGLGSGYKTLATADQIRRVRITLTSPKFLEPLVKEVGPDELSQPVVTVPFTNVPAGAITVKIQAIDEHDHVLGVKESTSTVASGQTTVLQMAVQLDAASGTGNLATVITFDEATPTPAPTATPTPTPTPTATPTPAPSATPTAGPVLLESSRFLRHLFTKPEAEITIKNTLESAASAKVYVYFYNDNTLCDSQAREIPLEPSQRMTFQVRSNVYSVNRVHVVVK